MHCVRKVTDNLYWVGANDHRLTLFENCFPIPRGVSYNAYLLLDEKSVLFDTVDWSGCRQLMENMEHQNKHIDYFLVDQETNETYVLASDGADEAIEFNPLSKNYKEGFQYVPEWDYNFDYYIYNYFILNYSLICPIYRKVN